MTPRTTPAARSIRRGSTFVALSAAALLATSCGTGEDSPAAQVEVTPPSGISTELGDTDAGEQFAVADLVTPEGEPRGTVEFAEVDGGTLITAKATNLPSGFHGLHIHATGLCEPDSENPSEPGERGAFLSAGGHLKGDDDGAVHPNHAGDLPPLYVAGDGSGEIVTFTDRVDRDQLLDDDGSAVMIHEKSDNLANIPERYAPDGPDEDSHAAGDGGSRIACGVVTEQG